MGGTQFWLGFLGFSSILKVTFLTPCPQMQMENSIWHMCIVRIVHFCISTCCQVLHSPDPHKCQELHQIPLEIFLLSCIQLFYFFTSKSWLIIYISVAKSEKASKLEIDLAKVFRKKISTLIKKHPTSAAPLTLGTTLITIRLYSSLLSLLYFSRLL